MHDAADLVVALILARRTGNNCAEVEALTRLHDHGFRMIFGSDLLPPRK